MTLIVERTANFLLVLDAKGRYRRAKAEEILHAAESLLLKQIPKRDLFDSPQAVRDYLRVRLGPLEYEVFGLLLLDAQHRLIEFTELFRGTLTQTAVYPREIVKLTLARNAAAVIMVHNHPSGVCEPSQADRTLTDVVKRTLELIDVRVLDHFVVTTTHVASFAERGWL